MYITDDAAVARLKRAEPTVYINPNYSRTADAFQNLDISLADVDDAAARLARFAPFIMSRFPETVAYRGLIESPLTEISKMKSALAPNFTGRLFAKRDCDLAVAGSIKARGGIYEVLKHAETLAVAQGLLREDDDYKKLAADEAREFFSRYAVQVGSTGNLGLSIGIMSAALGFRVTVHMSADARQWKKDLLCEKGVNVIEYMSDYSAAVVAGRKLSDSDPMSYFIDDENSRDLFMGYAVSAERTANQLDSLRVVVDSEHPLFVYIPCGVGGGPGGVAYGLKLIYGYDVHVFFVEPTQAPCMALGMATGLHNNIPVQAIGLTGKTQADGLAVGRPSGFVGGVMTGLLSGEFTVDDAALFDYMRALLATEGLFAEPSSCAAFAGPDGLFTYKQASDYISAHGLSDKLSRSTHIVWLTGGALVPEDIRKEYEGTRM